MSSACLIPHYRLDKVNNAIDSAEQNNWIVITKFDKNRVGPAKIREALLNEAFINTDIEFIRYLDDDDILLQYSNDIKNIFDNNEKIDIIYTDYILNTPFNTQHRITFSGNPLEDAMYIHPWSWIARVEALHRVKDVCGYLWNYEKSCREGTYCWIKFLEVGLNIKYVPIPIYQYNKMNNKDCVSQHLLFQRESENAYEIIQNLKKSRQC